MITKEQAISASEFHYTHEEKPRVGPRGGITMPRIEVWRRNGRTITWKTRPNDFKIPVKFGLYQYSYITQDHAEQFHTADDCPLNHHFLYKNGERVEVSTEEYNRAIAEGTGS